MEKHENGVLQCHPAFYAGLQIELADDRDNLIFENEHQLSSKPMEIDVLIVKKKNPFLSKRISGEFFE